MPADGLRLAGRGLADTTRLASSPANVWRDICQSNADAIGEAGHASQPTLGNNAVPRLGELSPDLIVVALLDGNTAGEALLALGAIVSLLYVVLFVATRGQTPGKQLLGLLVIDAYGERPSLAKTLLRTGGYALSVLPFSLGFLWIGFDREKRALHDWLAGTYVVLAP